MQHFICDLPTILGVQLFHCWHDDSFLGFYRNAIDFYNALTFYQQEDVMHSANGTRK
jgi:hypothetical protein